jgi:DNA processing protein
MSHAAADLDPELRDRLVLQAVAGLGPRRTKSLLERFGSASALRDARVEDLCAIPYLGEALAREILRALALGDVGDEWERIQKHGVHLLKSGQAPYPGALLTIYDPPPLLYVRGAITAADARAIAIVGSRHGTDYGRRVTEKFAAGLSRAGYTIVSGLARGIDGVAHRAALAAGGRTLAVLAGGLAMIYPPEHNKLADQVAASGALISEQPMALAPRPEMFPARNRLISGLCRGVLVVEAGERSGALLTAAHAAEQGRDVFAVPGNIDSPASAGTLRLIKDGATMVTCVEDILQMWEEVTPAATGLTQGEPAKAAAVAARPLPPMTETQRAVYGLLRPEALHADAIVQQSGLSVAEVANALITLEMKGLARRLPGNRYERR